MSLYLPWEVHYHEQTKRRLVLNEKYLNRQSCTLANYLVALEIWKLDEIFSKCSKVFDVFVLIT